MFARVVRTPSYRPHKPSGQAIVTLNDRDIYLGQHGSLESRNEYDRVIAKCLANGRHASMIPDITLNEVADRYLQFWTATIHPTNRPTSGMR